MPTLSVRTLLASLLTLIVLTLLAVPLHRQPIVSGQAPPTLTPLELAQIAEIRHVLTTYAADVWPGWASDIPPLLFRKGDFDYLIGHANPPADFEPVPDLQMDGEPILRKDGHLIPAPVATAWPVGDVWAATTPVRDEFQATVDEILGAGVVVLDDVAFIRAVVHEAFHAYQMNAFGGPEHLPDFTYAGNLAWLDTLTDDERLALDTALVAEGQALNEALADGATQAEIQAAIAMFLRLRDERRANLSDEATAIERAVEWTEGAARYSDTCLMLLAGSSDYIVSPEAAEVALIYPSAETVWEDFRAQLGDLLGVPGDYRDRFYVLGAAQMFILNRLTADWRLRLWEEGAAVEDLLHDYLTEENP